MILTEATLKSDPQRCVNLRYSLGCGAAQEPASQRGGILLSARNAVKQEVEDDGGAMPLDLLEQRIDRWIAGQKAG